MSLTMMAIRLAAVNALKTGGTIVGDQVFDSRIAAIDATADGALSTAMERPFIAVYSQSSKAVDPGNTGLRSNGQVDLLFNFGVSVAMASTGETGDSEILEGIPGTDANFEAIVDVTGHQICTALSDPENPWSQVFLDLVACIRSKQQMRSGSTAEQTRLACGQLILGVDVHADPVAGMEYAEESPWTRLLTLLEAIDPVRHGLIAGLLNGDAPRTETLLGISVQDHESLQLAPYRSVGRGVAFSEIGLETPGA